MHLFVDSGVNDGSTVVSAAVVVSSIVVVVVPSGVVATGRNVVAVSADVVVDVV